MFFVIGSLFLLASRSRELLPDWTIGDATPGSTCMFPGTLPCRLDSQRVSPHPLYNGLIRDTSPGAARSPDFARTFVWIYNPRNAGIIIIPHRRRRLRISRTLIISKILPRSKSYVNQQDSSESARLFRISPTPELDGFAPRLLFHRATALHSSPQLLGLSRAAPSVIEGPFRLLRVRGIVILWAPEPLFSDSSFRCPVPFCGSFSLWPQALLIYAHGLLLLSYACGPLSFMPTGF